MSEAVDLLINARWIVPVEPRDAVLADHAVAIRGGRIVDLLGQDEARTRYVADEVVELPRHLLIPGLVNLHTHAAMSLLRGIADDLPLMRWLEEAIWPAESRHVSAAFVRDGTLLAAAEMIRGGITTCSDMYFHPEAAAEAFAAAGMRAVVGAVVLEFPTSYASDPRTTCARAWPPATAGRATRGSASRSPRTRPTPSRTTASTRCRPSRTNSACRSMCTSTRPHKRSPTPSPSTAAGRSLASRASACSAAI